MNEAACDHKWDDDFKCGNHLGFICSKCGKYTSTEDGYRPDDPRHKPWIMLVNPSTDNK